MLFFLAGNLFTIIAQENKTPEELIKKSIRLFIKTIKIRSINNRLLIFFAIDFSTSMKRVEPIVK